MSNNNILAPLSDLQQDTWDQVNEYMMASKEQIPAKKACEALGLSPHNYYIAKKKMLGGESNGINLDPDEDDEEEEDDDHEEEITDVDILHNVVSSLSALDPEDRARILKSAMLFLRISPQTLGAEL